MTSNIIPALEDLIVPIDSVKPLHGNPRRGNVEAVARSLKRFGQVKPIVVATDTSEVSAGNHTLAAAKMLGWDEIAVVFVDHDETMAKAYALADNRTSDLGTYDDVDLAQMMSDVAAVDADLLEDTSWSQQDLDELLAKLSAKSPTELTDKDEAPRIAPNPFVREGDLWILGPHRLKCGDATSKADMDHLMGTDSADLVWTDPPYGVAVVGGTKDKLTIKNDEVDGTKLERMLDAAFHNTFDHTKPGGVWYVASPSGPFFEIFGHILSELGVWRQTIVWVKDSLVLGRADYHGRHESIFYGWTPPVIPTPPPPLDMSEAPSPEYDEDPELIAHFDEGYEHLVYGWKPGAAHQAVPTRKQDTVWEFPKPRRNPDHPTMKPVELIMRSIRNNTNPSQIVLDPFGGSGSTIIACHHTGRVGRLIELDPVYAEVICRRYQEHTGNLPINDRTGEPHDFTNKG